MKSAEKEAVMAEFARGEIQVLVATTVIEVGVDVRNATLMVIEHAERFGLAQLHQLRGRVGRGSAASSCVLLAYGRLSDVARARLAVMVETEDGFLIAEKDLELRGPGDFFGTRQWGMPSFRVANLLRDRDLMERARAEASRIAEAKSLPPTLEEFFGAGGWERRFGLARVG
jgi:ATP-dependent DNA helicase RecG